MTISADGVRFQRRKRNRWLLPAIIASEAVLSFFLFVSIAAQALWPEDSRAAAGVAAVLSYEGRLMDASGNPLGGTGTAYCMRFSIYDAPTGGTKLWPAGSPATTMATSTDGVFSALIGQADALTYNFYDSDTVYLNVDVNTTAVTCGGSWESLSPRQRVGATGYSQSAKNVYSTLLFTDNTNNRVQVGTGTGGAAPKFLGLDVKNTNDYIGQSCTTSGTVWYNSAISKALICENGIIQAISNSSATTTIAAVTTNTDTPAISGTIVFSNSNGVTFGVNGNTITASVAAGGAGPTLSGYVNYPVKYSTQTMQALASTFQVFPFVVSNNISFDYLRLLNSVSLASSSFASTANTTFSYNQAVTYRGVVYSKNVGASSMSLASISSFSAGLTYSLNAAYGSASNTSQFFTMGITYPVSSGTSSFSTTYGTNNLSTLALSTGNFTRMTGHKFLDIPFAGSLAPGEYWMALNASTTQTTQAVAALSNLRLLYSTVANPQTNVAYAYFGNVATASVQALAGVGSFTTVGGASTASMAFSNVSSSASHNIPYISLYKSSYY